MNQIDEIKKLLAEYSDSTQPVIVSEATAYVEAHKPPGVGRVPEVLVDRLLKQMAQPVVIVVSGVTAPVAKPKNLLQKLKFW